MRQSKTKMQQNGLSAPQPSAQAKGERIGREKRKAQGKGRKRDGGKEKRRQEKVERRICIRQLNGDCSLA